MRDLYKVLLLISYFTFALNVNAIEITQSYVVFKNVAVGEESPLQTIEISDVESFGEITLGESHKENFRIISDSCSNQQLEEGTSCRVELQFTPVNRGIKSGVLQIPWNDTQEITVLLTNYEEIEEKAKKRLPPIVSELHIPEEMNATQSYDINWSAMGYHSGYKTRVVIFDCTDITDGTCGSSYSKDEKFYESDTLSSIETLDSDWSYGGVNAQVFNYSDSFSVPETRADGSDWDENGTSVVIRFYTKSDEDAQIGKSALSLIIPGGLSNEYYDSSGRKVQKIICPESGCSQGGEN